LLDWGVVTMTLLSAGASALAALIAFRHDDTSAMAEAMLAFGAAVFAAWLGRSASRAAQRWQDELVAWHGNDIALLLDEAGRILDGNDRASEAYGLIGDALYRLDVRDLRHADATDDLTARLADLRGRGRLLFETVQRRGDGAPFPAEVSARVVRIRGHDLFHLIIRDLTEAHETHDRLVASERLAAVGSVAAAMAHDINNPLCGVQGNLAYALDALDDPRPDVAEVRRALLDAKDSATRVRDLVRDLNAFANGFTEVDAVADLAAVLAETVKASQGEVARKCRVVVDLPTLPRIQAPARRLSQVFRILVRDAARAMPDGDPALHAIRISARVEATGRIAVLVADDGPLIAGTPPTEPFGGLPKVGRDGSAGLAAVVGMVRAVGGDVVTHSTAEEGNVVRVHLPAAGNAARTPAPTASAVGRPRLGPQPPRRPQRALLPE
jgi:PAS domain S-box-containing protein